MAYSSRWQSLLGLAQRANKIVSGEDFVIAEIRKQRAKLVLLAEDASENTKKLFNNKCEFYNVPLKIIADRKVLGSAIGKEMRVAIAILDTGFTKKILEYLEDGNNDS